VSDERDACALVSIARKDGRASREVLDGVLHGMAALAHRSGLVDGEGDGAGVLTDIPRAIWATVLRSSGEDATVVRSGRFAVGHLFIPPTDGDADQAAVRRSLARRGIEILAEREDTTDSSVLGPRGRTEEPRFWQLALIAPSRDGPGSRALYEATVEIERLTAATVVSLSRHTAVYKLRGAGHQLPRYFADLADPRFATSMAFGHNRYATNTSTSFDRVQPFATFAHNGEINTIGRLREEAKALRIALSRSGSDSQDVDAVLRGMVLGLRLTPVEAIELLFPPIVNEMKRMPAELQDLYIQARAAFGPFAQGPAAFLARIGDTCLFGVDALGLRPLWHVETPDEHVFASERGFIPLESYVRDPYPLGPGERVGLRRTTAGWRFLDQDTLRRAFVADRTTRGVTALGLRERIACGGPEEALESVRRPGARREPTARWQIATPPDELEDPSQRREQQFASLGFEPDDLKMAQFAA